MIYEVNKSRLQDRHGPIIVIEYGETLYTKILLFTDKSCRINKKEELGTKIINLPSNK